jgi:hypothetical protein
MRILSVSFSLLALALSAGCAHQSDEAGTSRMGAGPAAARTVNCRDGAWVTSTTACGNHGGVERVTSGAGK